MVNADQRIGRRYLTQEVESAVLALQDGNKKMKEVVDQLQPNLTRNQVRFLLKKLIEDGIAAPSGKLKGARYSLTSTFADFRGSTLVNEVLSELRSKHALADVE